jgi:hypothetical protein
MPSACPLTTRFSGQTTYEGLKTWSRRHADVIAVDARLTWFIGGDLTFAPITERRWPTQYGSGEMRASSAGAQSHRGRRIYMPSVSKVPPAQLVRAVERLRHHVYRLHQRLVPPQFAMIELIMAAQTSDVGVVQKGATWSSMPSRVLP